MSTLIERRGRPAGAAGAWVRKNITFLAPVLVFLVIYGLGGLLFRNFFSVRVFLNLLTDNAYLGMAAVGMTFVILSGGIDLSVGAVVSTTAMIIAVLTREGVPPAVAIPAALAFGLALGLAMGAVIHFFKAPPFIVTLSGMFLARGIGYVLSLESVPINEPFYSSMSQLGLALGGGVKLTVPAVMFILLVALGIYLSTSTRFGRNAYAIGGNEQSALLMGLPVGRTKLLIYTLSGLCSALGGVVYTFYTLAGYGVAAIGLELDAIASVVIGGTLLTGGVGSVVGTLVGVLIQGLIQTIIAFQGQLNVYWTKFFVGAMLFIFILLQKAFVLSTARKGR